MLEIRHFSNAFCNVFLTPLGHDVHLLLIENCKETNCTTWNSVHGTEFMFLLFCLILTYWVPQIFCVNFVKTQCTTFPAFFSI